MLTAYHISKSYGLETVLESVSFTMNPGERLGLVGPNGSGKTTLLRILAGLEQADTGGLRLDPPDLRRGYLPQGFAPGENQTLGGFLRLAENELPALSARLEELASALAAGPGQANLQANLEMDLQANLQMDLQANLQMDLQAEYDEVLSRLASVAEEAGRGPAVLAALGLGDFPLDTPVANLSGGQKTRLALAEVLLSDPQLLLLDEPTNHLDLDMLEWLEGWLSAYSGAALIVSHDRAFLDRVATGILEIDGRTHRLSQYAGNYTAYLEQKLAERDRQRQAYTDQQEEIARLRLAAAQVRHVAKFRPGGKGDSGDKFAKGFFSNRSAGTIRRAKQLEQRLEQLLTEERVEKPKPAWQMKLDFADSPAGKVASGRDVLALKDLSVGYGEHVLLSSLDQRLRYGDRVALIGPNGTGKTTLLRTIAGMLEPLRGRVRLGTNVRAGYMRQEQEDLDPQLDAFTTLRRFAPLSETETRTFLHRFLFSGDEVFVPVGSLSYGERARLSLACLVALGSNLLLLDEPLNHLDIPSRSRFEQAISSFEGTVLAVVHDRYFIEGFASEVWEVEGQRLHARWQKVDFLA